MGFLRRLFRAKKSDSPTTKNKHRSWNLFIKHQSKASKSQISTSDLNHNDFAPNSSPLFANKHAIAVAAATAAVAEAALAAAAAAAEVVRITGGGGGGSLSTSSLPAAALLRRPEEIAAVKIQSAFRRYLAKRALRALKALVKLQALVRGHIVRKQTADMLRRMHTLVRLQSRARASRVHLSHSVLHPNKSPLSHHPVPEYFDHPLRSFSTKFDGSSVLKRCNSNANFREIGSVRANWFDNWMEENIWNHHVKDDDIDDEKKSDKILEVDDTWKPPQQILKKSHQNENNKNVMMMNMMGYEYDQSPSKRSTRRLIEQKASSKTTENSPEAFSFSSSRRKSPFTPTKSECGGYMAHPNYMANTESSLAKVRSLSVPRQRNSDLRTQQQFLTSSGSGLFSRIGSPNLR